MSPPKTKKTDGAPSPDLPDLDDLARDYMDLWQKHLAGLVGDDALTDLMAKTAALMNAPLTDSWADPATNPFLAAFTAASKASDHDTDKPDASSSRTKAAAAADGDPDDDVDELRRRVAVLEKRIAELEGGATPKRKRPAKKTAKR